MVSSHLGAPTGKAHRAALDSSIRFHGDYKEVERGLTTGPHLGTGHRLPRVLTGTDFYFRNDQSRSPIVSA
jgi:hypothetical protein